MKPFDTLDDLLSSDSVFRILSDHLFEGVYVVDLDRKIRLWSNGAERLTGFKRDEVIGFSCADDILEHVDCDGNSLCKDGCPLAATTLDGVEREALVFLHHKDGHRVPVSVRAVALRAASGKVVGAMELFHDRTPELAALTAVAEEERESLLCSVTGIGSTAYSQHFLDGLFKDVPQGGDSRVLLLVGVDRLAELREAYGPNVANLTLKMVARTLCGAIQPHEFIGRWSNSEFILVLYAKSIKVMEMAVRLRTLVHESSRRVTQGKIAVTVSIGGTILQPDDTEKYALARATLQLDASRRGGGNRVNIA